MSDSSGGEFETLGGWPGLLRELAAGRDLDPAYARAALGQVLEGSATDAQTAAFIFGLKVKGEAPAEIAGLVQAMLAAAAPLELDDPRATLDIVGTGGSRALGGRAFNVSTMAAIVAGGAGAKVCKHGNRKASSTSGSTDLLEALGVEVDLDGPGVARCVREAGVGFAFARVFHPSMRFAAPVRAELGVPTVFNLLGPLAHPGQVGRQVVGVADPSLVNLVAESLLERGVERAWIVNGDELLDELTTTGVNSVVEVRAGQLTRFEIDASTHGMARTTNDELGVGDPGENARVARGILAGEPGPLRDMVVLNAAAGLVVADVAVDLDSGIEAAAASIDSGRAATVLDSIIEVSRSA
ncbi:MAG: anthranilate phosphoribosyltransferase [Microthrixaceae bacterium]|nr:anthranilate phosphoribosyltransferase [Microthrixaceae bacterium]